MIRLNQRLREHITKAALDDFDKRHTSTVVAETAEEVSLAKEARDAILGEHKDAIDSLPEKWFNRTDHIQIDFFEEGPKRKDRPRYSRTLSYGKKFPMPGTPWEGWPAENLPKDLLRRLTAFCNKRQDRINERHELAASIAVVLAMFRTVEQLLQERPKLEKIVKEGLRRANKQKDTRKNSKSTDQTVEELLGLA